MKTFIIAIGLLGCAARVEAQRLTMRIGELQTEQGSLVVAATDYGLVRVEAGDSAGMHEVDVGPLEARDYARAFGVPQPMTVEEMAHPQAVRTLGRVVGQGGSLWLEWQTLGPHVQKFTLVLEPPREQPIRLALKTDVGMFLQYLATAAKETAALSLTPTGIDSAKAGAYGFEDYQVEVPARPLSNQLGPMYPPSLSREKVQGEVVVRYLVTARGTVDTTTIQIVRSTNPLFAGAVTHALARLRFIPARIGERFVSQWVETTYPFRLGGTAGE